MEPYSNADKKWYIKINGQYPSDIAIAKILDINYDSYIKILEKHNANFYDFEEEYWFDTKKQIKAAITELEPYYILKRLMGEVI